MNYDEIVAAALAYADRASDIEVKANMDVFLRAVENRLNNLLTVQKMSTRTQLTMVADKEYYGLPSDFQALRDIEIHPVGDSPVRNTLQYLNPEQMNNWSTLTAEGQQDRIYYTIIADQLHIVPPQDNVVLEIVYFRNVPQLTPTADTNWVSANQYNLYIFGLEVEINSFLKDKEAAAMWDSRFNGEVGALKLTDSIDRWSGSPLQIRPESAGI